MTTASRYLHLTDEEKEFAIDLPRTGLDTDLPRMITQVSTWLSTYQNSYFGMSFHTNDLLKIRSYLMELRAIKLKEAGF